MMQYPVLFIYLVVILPLYGCRTSRHVLKTDTQVAVETKQSGQINTEEKIKDEFSVKTDLIQAQEVVTQIIDFDTTLPVSPATGTPPVKRKTIQTKRTTAQTQQNVMAERNSSSDTFENRVISGKGATSTIAEDISKRGLNSIQNLLCLTGLFSLFALTVYILVRRFR